MTLFTKSLGFVHDCVKSQRKSTNFWERHFIVFAAVHWVATGENQHTSKLSIWYLVLASKRPTSSHTHLMQEVSRFLTRIWPASSTLTVSLHCHNPAVVHWIWTKLRSRRDYTNSCTADGLSVCHGNIHWASCSWIFCSFKTNGIQSVDSQDWK